MCLLYLLGLVCNDECVGEMDFSKMEAKELLKQQVRMLKEEVIEVSHGMSSTRTNKVAKQILRALSVWSILQMADATKLTDWYGIHSIAFEALGQRHGTHTHSRAQC